MSPEPIVENSIYSLIERRAELSPDAPMLFDEHERTMTFGEYHAQVQDLAAGLLDAGITPGSRIGWQLPTSFDALVLAGALSRLGCAQILLLPAYRMRELRHIIGQAEPTTIIVRRESAGFDFLGQARELQAEFPELQVLAVEAIPRGSLTPLPSYVEPTPDEMRWLIYTSGTTGAPKGVMHSDATVIAGARANFLAAGILPTDRQTLNYPFAHIGGIMTVVTMTSTGSSNVIVERFEPAKHVPLFRELGVTIPGAGPPFFRMYLEEQRKQPGESILPDARLFNGGGAPKTPTMHEELKNEIGGAGIFTGFGMSECPLITTMRIDSPEEKKALTEGMPAMWASVCLVDPDGHEVGPGEEGEVLVKGPQLFLGYLDPAANEGAFEPDGHFHTGDLGRFDADGYLRLTGRLKDLIIRKGENISAREIEDMLESHPQVAEVAVIGLADDERGEMCCAVVVPTDADNPIEFEEMSTHLATEGLSRPKIPERLEIVDELPKNVMGKVQKNKLRDLYAPVR
jgi:acyl-CoA synthetase (AMP-forming)/AMP-acid ligase II